MVRQLKRSTAWFIKNYVSGKWLLVVFAIVFMAIEGSMLGFISYAVKSFLIPCLCLKIKNQYFM